MTLEEVIRERYKMLKHTIHLVKGGGTTVNTLSILMAQKELLEGIIEQWEAQSNNIK